MNKIIWILAHYAQEPPYNTMLRYHNWGKELVKHGYQVTIITSSIVHNTNLDVIDEISNNTHFCDGIRYVYVKGNRYDGNGLKRMFNMFSYYRGVCNSIYTFEKPNLIISGIPHALVALKSLKIAKNLKISCIVDVLDLWPEAIVQCNNVKRSNPLILGLAYFEKKIYKKATALIFSMEGGRQYIKDIGILENHTGSKVFHINMGIDLNEFDSNKSCYEAIKIEGDAFKIGYCGSIRLVNNVGYICDTAKEIAKRGYHDIRFYIYGNGDQEQYLKEYCLRNGIDNIEFRGRIDKKFIAAVLSSMDINLLNYVPIDLYKYGGSMSKMFDYFAAGRPVICNTRFGYDLIERYQAGKVAQRNDVISYADSILEIYNMNSNEREAMGMNARRAAEDYDLSKMYEKLEKVIEYATEIAGT